MKIKAPPIEVPPPPEWIGKAFVESKGKPTPSATGCVRENDEAKKPDRDK